MHRFLDQVTDYQSGSNFVYLATTYKCIAEYCFRGGAPLDAKILQKKLNSTGAGFLIVDTTTNKIIEKQESDLDKNQNSKVFDSIKEGCKNKKYIIYQLKY